MPTNAELAAEIPRLTQAFADMQQNAVQGVPQPPAQQHNALRNVINPAKEALFSLSHFYGRPDEDFMELTDKLVKVTNVAGLSEAEKLSCLSLYLERLASYHFKQLPMAD